MKNTFMIMFHNNFEQLKKLITFLDNEDTSFILACDKKVSSDKLKEKIMSYVKKSCAKYIEVDIFWGGVSQIYATLHMIQESFYFEYDYLHFITNADLPLMKIEEMCEKLKDCKYEYINFAPENYEFAKFKCNYYHLLVENKYYRNSKILKIINHGQIWIQKRMGVNRRHDKLYHGSAYFSITKDLAKYIINKKENIQRAYKFTLGADEVWLQTLVMNSEFKKRIYKFEDENGHLRYIDWKRRCGNSPYTFKISDKDEIKAIKGKYLFSRKFDENVDSNIIDYVYKILED